MAMTKTFEEKEGRLEAFPSSFMSPLYTKLMNELTAQPMLLIVATITELLQKQPGYL